MKLEQITDDRLGPFAHGFFTRAGGASSGIYSGLNCGQGSSDQSAAVAINRSRVADCMGVDVQNLVSLHQVHSANVLHITQPITNPRHKADAMVTTTPGIALGVLSADCQPVLFADSTAGVIGAAHAGWKGALGGVLGATVEAMVGLGSKRQDIVAVVGPCISQHAYEVGSEFRAEILKDDANHQRFFTKGSGEKYQFDLPEFGLHCLNLAGVEQAFWTGYCTYSDAGRFYSYRRSRHRQEADYGRLISTIRI